jgi:hypothetical protein
MVLSQKLRFALLELAQAVAAGEEDADKPDGEEYEQHHPR